MSVEQVKKLLKEKEYTIGANQTLKNLKRSKTDLVVLSSDCKPETKAQIMHYKKVGNINVIEVGINSAELGALCKKQFSIAVLSF